MTAGQHVGFVDTTSPFPTLSVSALSDADFPNSASFVVNGNRFGSGGAPNAATSHFGFANLRVYEILLYRRFHTDNESRDVMKWLLLANLK
jgi:hypothetical protein